MAKLNAEIIDALKAIEDAAIPPLHTLSAVEAREAFLSLRARVGNPTEVRSVNDTTIPASGQDVPVRIYRPDDRNNLPALVWLHGGGWVLGDLDSADLVCRDLCHHSGFVVISVDYRLAPEAVFPAAFDNSLGVTRWVSDNADSLNIDRNRLVVGGDSAGGNLAAAVAVAARDQQIPVAAQLLIYPVIEANFNNASYTENADGYFLTKPMMAWFWDQYIPDKSMRTDIRVAPINADLKNLPPAIVLTVEHDPLRDEGVAFANALKRNGVDVYPIHVSDTIHGYFGMDIECGKSERIDTANMLREFMQSA